MSTFAILPIKQFAAAKSRLAEQFDPRQRQTLAQAMCTDVLTSLEASRTIEETVVVTSDGTAETIALEHGTHVIEDHSDSHSTAAAQGIEYALARGATQVLLVAGDCPLLSAELIDELLDDDPPGDRVVVEFPDRHGAGTNGLLLRPPNAIEPAFGPGSCERHLQLAATAGADAVVLHWPAFEFDVDTPEDLQALAAELRNQPNGAPKTRAALAALKLP